MELYGVGESNRERHVAMLDREVLDVLRDLELLPRSPATQPAPEDVFVKVLSASRDLAVQRLSFREHCQVRVKGDASCPSRHVL